MIIKEIQCNRKLKYLEIWKALKNIIQLVETLQIKELELFNIRRIKRLE